MRIVFAVFLFVHAAAHAVGFISLSGIVEVEGTDGTPSLLLTGLEPGGAPLKAVAVLWLVGLGAFVLGGIGVVRQSEWALGVLLAAAVFSLVLCILWYKDTPFGIVANVLILAAVLIPALSDRVLPS